MWVLMMLNTHTSGCCCLNCAAVLATARAAAAGAKWAAWQELCSPEPAVGVSVGVYEQALPSLEAPARLYTALNCSYVSFAAMQPPSAARPLVVRALFLPQVDGAFLDIHGSKLAKNPATHTQTVQSNLATSRLLPKHTSCCLECCCGEATCLLQM